MKQLIFLFFIMIIFYSCGKEEPSNLSAYNAEAFAFDIGDSWEVNASTRVKGFEQKIQADYRYLATIAYDVNLITPAGDTLRSLISKVEDKNANEKMTDIGLEAQFELDSTYTEGEYRVIFMVKDVLTGNNASTSASFKIENE